MTTEQEIREMNITEQDNIIQRIINRVRLILLGCPKRCDQWEKPFTVANGVVVTGIDCDVCLKEVRKWQEFFDKTASFTSNGPEPFLTPKEFLDGVVENLRLECRNCVYDGTLIKRFGVDEIGYSDSGTCYRCVRGLVRYNKCSKKVVKIEETNIDDLVIRMNAETNRIHRPEKKCCEWSSGCFLKIGDEIKFTDAAFTSCDECLKAIKRLLPHTSPFLWRLWVNNKAQFECRGLYYRDFVENSRGQVVIRSGQFVKSYIDFLQSKGVIVPSKLFFDMITRLNMWGVDRSSCTCPRGQRNITMLDYDSYDPPVPNFKMCPSCVNSLGGRGDYIFNIVSPVVAESSSSASPMEVDKGSSPSYPVISQLGKKEKCDKISEALLEMKKQQILYEIHAFRSHSVNNCSSKNAEIVTTGERLIIYVPPGCCDECTKLVELKKEEYSTIFRILN